MGFLSRFLSLGNKSRRKEKKNVKSKKNIMFMSSSSTGNLLTVPQDEEAVVNRLLRSSSTHFSVLSETEYRSLPPIPHPINNVLRAPSIMSNATSNDTYTVTIRHRTVHSCTEFPNANRGGRSSSPPHSPVRPTHPRIPPLTPGDKNRLESLRRDTSVLSLLDVYDETGHLNPEAFSNTPATASHEPSLRQLLGDSGMPSLTNSRTISKASLEESDISWAERYIRTAHVQDVSSSSLGIPEDLFKDLITPDDLRLDQSGTTSEMDAGIDIDSLQVEPGTTEDASIIKPSLMSLTSPTRRASQFFKFLSDIEPQHLVGGTLTPLPASHTEIPVHFVREGPKESQARVSPAKLKYPSIGYRAPFDTVNWGSFNTNQRSASTASSVHPQIEHSTEMDPYTPIPRRIRESMNENLPPLPPNAPARPVRGNGQNRRYSARKSVGPDPTRTAAKEHLSLPKILKAKKRNSLPVHGTPPSTPAKPHNLHHLRPSPASSSELSPEGRQIMALVRAKVRTGKPSLNAKTRVWQSFGDPD